MTDKPQKLPNNFNVLTFTTPCPSCGATVEFVSAGSAMAVCEYCQTTVVRQGDQISSQGKQSLTIEDYSPLQIGSVGTYQNNQFVIVGRIQMEYGEGIWNEWYIQFANGHNGWLSEALGQYSLTLDKGEHPELPTYHQLAINHSVNFENTAYTVTDKRTAVAIAGEGELPFVMGKGWQTWVIDAREQRKLITLDYGEHGADGAPTVFKGVAVPLDSLQMQMLKESNQVNQSSSLAGYGGLNGELTLETDSNVGQSARQQADQVGKIDCPNCGSPVPFVAGITNCLMCPACHSEIKMTGANAQVVETHSRMQNFQSSLPLGAKARINSAELSVSQFSSSEGSATGSARHHDYVVVGIQRLQEVGSYASWTEYLLYSFTDGFLWLSEEPKRGWMLSRVLNDFPERQGNGIYYDGRVWNNYDGVYQSRVTFAVGAFNWQVKVNDYMDLIDYTNGQDVITAEQNESEITYTLSTSLSNEQMQAWFGSQFQAIPATSNAYNAYDDYDDDYDDDDWDDDDEGGITPKKIIVVGLLIISVIFFSIGAFVFNIIMGVLAFLAIHLFTDDDDFGPSMFGYAIAVICLILAFVMNTLFFGGSSSDDKQSSGGSTIIYSSGGYSSGGRTGYSSSGSHK